MDFQYEKEKAMKDLREVIGIAARDAIDFIAARYDVKLQNNERSM